MIKVRNIKFISDMIDASRFGISEYLYGYISKALIYYRGNKYKRDNNVLYKHIFAYDCDIQTRDKKDNIIVFLVPVLSDASPIELTFDEFLHDTCKAENEFGEILEYHIIDSCKDRMLVNKYADRIIHLKQSALQIMKMNRFYYVAEFYIKYYLSELVSSDLIKYMAAEDKDECIMIARKHGSYFMNISKVERMLNSNNAELKSFGKDNLKTFKTILNYYCGAEEAIKSSSFKSFYICGDDFISIDSKKAFRLLDNLNKIAKNRFHVYIR